MSRFLDELHALLGPSGVLVDPDTIAPYLTDWRGVFTGTAQAVTRPSTTAEVAAVVTACARARVPVVPQGGNTGLAAGATPLGLADAVVLNLSRMHAIRHVDAAGNVLVAEAGCVLTDVQAQAASAGRLFPLSLAAEGSAQIGGLVATNAGGTAVLRYGSMRALVLGLEVVLPDGRILDGLRELRKDNAGYDWKHVFIGSEGTLGIVTAAALRLFPAQRTSLTALLSAASLEDAMAAFSRAYDRFGDFLSAAEVFPDRAVALRIEHESTLEFPLARDVWYVLVEAASSLDGLEDRLEDALLEIAESGTATGCIVAQSAAQRDALWEWRETITESERRAGRSAKHDVSVAVSAVAEFVAEATREVEARFPGCTVLPFGHAGDGNIHFNVLLPTAGDVAPSDVNAVVHAIVARYCGSITAEHGIGRYRREELPAHRSPAEMDLMHSVKRAIDPDDRLNPGAVL